jgi:hypothetical protein
MWHHDATRPHRELGKASQWLAAVGGEGALPGQVYWVVPGLLMLCLGIWHVGRPELWRDESLTWSALTRPLPDFVRCRAGQELGHSSWGIPQYRAGIVGQTPSAHSLAVRCARALWHSTPACSDTGITTTNEPSPRMPDGFRSGIR